MRVHLRTLQYPRNWPTNSSKEKGVDVEMAIEIVRSAITGAADVLIVATRDTDLVRALDLVTATTQACVELATWQGQSELKIASQPKVVRLGKTEYNRSRDTNNYA